MNSEIDLASLSVLYGNYIKRRHNIHLAGYSASGPRELETNILFLAEMHNGFNLEL